VTGKSFKKIPALAKGEAADEDDVRASEKESALLSRNLSPEDIQSEVARNEHHRSERFRNHFEHVAVFSLWVLAVVLLSVGLTWFWHIISPERWHWLEPDQVSRLQNVMTGGILASLAGNHMKKRLG